MEKTREEERGNRESWVGKDKVLVQTRGEGRTSDFWVVDLRDNKVMKLGGRVGLLWDHNIPHGLIAVDSVIYAIGRYKPDSICCPKEEEGGIYHHDHTGTSFLDLADPSGRWKGIGGMLISNRPFPCCASLSDKIFVFGAKASKAHLNLGEFYDKKKNCWEAIPSPPLIRRDAFRHCRPVICDPEHNRILVHFSYISSLYAYYPEDGHRWVCLNDHMPPWDGEPAPYLLDNVLYLISYKDNCITAFDICTKEHLEVSWSSCSPFGPHELAQLTSPCMIYLGDNIMCVYPYAPSSFEYYRFQVCRVSNQQQGVLITPLSTHLFLFQGPRTPINTVAL